MMSGGSSFEPPLRFQPEPAPTSDNELLRAVARGDETALAQVYDRYRLILFGLIVRILHSREEAEDVLQEVFLQVWRRAKDFDEARGRAFTWLVTVARSRALDRLRSLGARARLAEAAPPIEYIGDAAADVFQSEQAEVIRRALAQIPVDQRQALFLGYFEGLTQSEIAARLGAPLGTVKTRMRTGMTKLRELLQERKEGAGGGLV
jgi:RNA polymerase sigma-70 factor (ECF subfamily)